MSDARLDPARALDAIARVPLTRAVGVVREVVGLVIRAVVPDVRHGDLVYILPDGAVDPAVGPAVAVESAAALEPALASTQDEPNAALAAEVVGFRGDEAILLPLGRAAGLGPRSRVLPSGRRLSLACSEHLLGRVVDGLGRPIDGGPAITAGSRWPVDRPAPPPLSRPRIRTPLATGVRAIDGLLTLGRGQRIGLFSGSGVGKSTLLGQITRSSTADVNVICLVGERGREVREFLEDCLGADGRRRSVVVCATSDAPSLVRLRSAHVATAIAEWFRDRGADVLLLMDSLTRFARAQREVALSAGEPPARRGFPPSVFAALPQLIERAGQSENGSITGIYTVLVASGDMREPIADEVRGALDGHIVLDRALAARGHLPPIDVLASVSRVMPHVTDDAHRAAAARVRRRLAIFEAHRDLISLGAYETGTQPDVDDAIAHIRAIERFLCQPPDELTAFDDVVAQVNALSA